MKENNAIETKLVVTTSECFLAVKNVWTGSKIGKLGARKLALHLINVAEINTQQN